MEPWHTPFMELVEPNIVHSFSSPLSSVSRSNMNIFPSKGTHLRYDTNFSVAHIKNPAKFTLLSTASPSASSTLKSNSHAKRTSLDATAFDVYKRNCQSLLRPVNGSGQIINKYAVSPAPIIASSNEPFDILVQFHHQIIICRKMTLDSEENDDPIIEISFSKMTPTYIESVALDDDVIIMIGFTSGDIILWHILDATWSRFNKGGMYNASPVSGLQWIPGTHSHFLAGFRNGIVVIFDRFKEELPFSFTSPESAQIFHVIHPTASIQDKSNPVSIWHVCSQALTSLGFSPDMRHVAIVSRDGFLRIIDILSERLLDSFQSYYGAFLSVAWSPDGHLLATGGEDDLVSIWSLQEKRLLARCHGHQSFVSCVAFDPLIDEKTKLYRLASVRQDGLACFWEFDTKATYPKPRSSACHSFQPSSSRSFKCSVPVPTPGHTPSGSFQLACNIHPALSHFDVPTLEPAYIMALSLTDSEPLTYIAYDQGQRLLLIRTLGGKIKVLNVPTDDMDSLIV